MAYKQQHKRELLEEMPTVKPGDRVLRWQKKQRGIVHALSATVSRLFRRTASK